MIMTNIQVTYDTNPNNARSESYLAINPNDPSQIVGGSKKFKNIQNYDFTIATVYSFDNGLRWRDSADIELLPDWSGISDPALAWDDVGNVYLVGLAFINPPDVQSLGIAVYKSTDRGQTWGKPNFIHSSTSDDKQWAAGDTNPNSPYHGRIYAVWDGSGGMLFARTLDHGNTWIGAGNDPLGSVIANNSFSPEINVANDGTIYIVWVIGDQIKMLVSTNGGDSFHEVMPPATGIKTLGSALPAPNSYSIFYPNGNFRVVTLPTACVGENKEVVVAWADYRNQLSSRIYYAFSDNGGNSWKTGPSGQPLLSGPLPANQQHFHPQIAFDGRRFGCAFYEFGPKPNKYMIDVRMAFSSDHCTSFDFDNLYPMPDRPFDPTIIIDVSSYGKSDPVTDQPWDPTIDAPWSRGKSDVTFIGEYFGLDASRLGFHLLWTDTRTGIQELWTDIPPVITTSDRFQQAVQILAGIINDAGGIEIVGGHFRRVPPRSPSLDILLSIASHRIATLIDSPQGLVLQKTAMDTVVKLAQKEIQRLQKEISQKPERQYKKSER
jgi:hypothetical protein